MYLVLNLVVRVVTTGVCKALVSFVTKLCGEGDFDARKIFPVPFCPLWAVYFCA